jgi:SHS2 domain-containing protein
MGRAETFEHTADLGLRVVADDLADLFETAAAGLFDVIVANRLEIREIDEERFALAAESVEALFLAWLDELIFLCETRHRLYRSYKVAIDEERHCLEATIRGEPIDPDRHVLDHEVKAATRHGLVVRPEAGGWLAEVILDI